MIATARISERIACAAGAELRRLRLAAGLSQAQVARFTDSHRPIVSRVDRGVHTTSLEVCELHAVVCGGSLADVLRAVDRALGLGALAVLAVPRRVSRRVSARVNAEAAA